MILLSIAFGSEDFELTQTAFGLGQGVVEECQNSCQMSTLTMASSTEFYSRFLQSQTKFNLSSGQIDPLEFGSISLIGSQVGWEVGVYPTGADGVSRVMPYLSLGIAVASYLSLGQQSSGAASMPLIGGTAQRLGVDLRLTRSIGLRIESSIVEYLGQGALLNQKQISLSIVSWGVVPTAQKKLKDRLVTP